MTDQKDHPVHVVVPVEAVEAARARDMGAYRVVLTRGEVKAMLADAAPAIVAANQPKTNDDLSAGLAAVFDRFTTDQGVITTGAVPDVEAFVAAQVAGARADERAQIARELYFETKQRGDLDIRTATALVGYISLTARMGIPGSIQRALNEEADRG